MSGWPSGLRRQTQELYSSLTIERSGPRMRAWVRIPLLTKTFFSFAVVAFISFGHFHSPKCSLGSFHDVVSIDERDGLTLFFAVEKKQQEHKQSNVLFSLFFLGNGWRRGNTLQLTTLSDETWAKRNVSHKWALLIICRNDVYATQIIELTEHWAYPSPLRRRQI